MSSASCETSSNADSDTNMSKRRRTSSVASRGNDEESLDPDPAPDPPRKRKKMDPSEMCQMLYEAIRNHKKEDGSLLCDAFIRVPKRRQEPGYYEVVSNPIDLLKVQQKLKTDEYEDVEDLTNDIQLLVNNAKAFYKRISPEYKDACDIWDLFVTSKNRLLELEGRAEDAEHKGKIILKVGKLARRAAAAAEAKRQDNDAEDNSESSTNPDDELNQFEDLFTAVMTATDQDNRPLHTCFQLLPSKKRYPEYYEVIENPIDLKIIATKIQENKYATLNDLEKDLLLLTRNATLFNEPGSQIYKDAKALRKIISSKKIEVEHGKYTPGKSSERIRNKRLRGVQSLSAVTAALKDEDEDSDEGGGMDEEELEDADNPQWQLYECVKNTTNHQGHLLSEPFWKLPSKRYYPDYYKEIKNPVSLFQIRNKLKRGDYGTLSEVAGDMNIMFENAKKYNRVDSRLYKDAVKLQKKMQAKVQELLDFDQVKSAASHQDSESEGDSDERGGRRKGGRRASGLAGTRIARVRERERDPPPQSLPLKKRLQILFKTLVDYVEENGRQPILMFMEKPSKKLYPDYFEVIAEPIDMLTIESHIKDDKYSNEEEFLADLKLMFSNCRQYNEEGSMIYEDANKLEELLMEKVKEIMPTDRRSMKGTKPSKTMMNQKLRILYDTIRDYRDPKQRQLSLIFMKLPSKIEYPDYYEVIKRPIVLENIAQKLKAGQYESLDDMVADFVLMFDNACKYNEPDSQIYKDALMLQRVTLQTKLRLRQDEDALPDVAAAVQELLTSLFTALYNHQDEEGRCFSDSMAELPEHDEVDGSKVRALSLDLIKRRLDRGLYRRLDSFQEDIFACMERARRLSRTDSQVFEDSIELQSCFIRQRDELCRNGELLQSPALSYTLLHLAAAVEATRQQKLLQEQPSPEDEAETRSSDDSNLKDPSTNVASGDSMSFNHQVYHVGDFVYAEPKERGVEPTIIHIERLWTNQEGQQMMYGNVFFRPNETYHVTTRKFLEKEVFKSELHTAVPLNHLQGLCCVLSVKDYFRSRPDGYADKDVYVCESRYSTKARAFKKIKVWPYTMSQNIKLVPRDEAIEPKRHVSVFRERVEKHKEEIAELEELEKFVEKEKPNVEVLNANNPEGFIYYEQYNAPACILKTGDFVYVRTDSGRQLMSQVDTIWTNKQGTCYFSGPLFISPPEITYSPPRLFYKQEVFLSTVEDTYLVENVLGRCTVLEHGDYISCRPTEIAEQDVYVCESLYDEARRQVKKLSRDGLRKYNHSNAVTEDEIYYFRRLINPPKVGSDCLQNQPEMKTGLHYEMAASPLLPKMMAGGDSELLLLEDSLDGGPPSVGSGEIPMAPAMGGLGGLGLGLGGVSMATPAAKKKASGKKLVTGYILYSSDVRRSVAASHPDSSFGEISRIVGNEWRNLPSHEKQSWEEKAAKVNEETAAKQAESESCPSPAPPSVPNPTAGPNAVEVIYECCWDNCDWQFEDISDCTEHCVNENTGHVQAYFASLNQASESDYQCQWRGCMRVKKGSTPFPNLQRLARHVKELHIQKGNGRHITVSERSRNYVPARRPGVTLSRPLYATSVQTFSQAGLAPGQNATHITQQSFSRQTPSPLAQVTGGMGGAVGAVPAAGVTIAANQRPLEPLFVSVPPRPQRLLHSEAYIRYIEGLQADIKHISPWEKHLKATQENTLVPDVNRLPADWLGNGVGNHGNIVNALWTLRDFMLRDALGINKIL